MSETQVKVVPWPVGKGKTLAFIDHVTTKLFRSNERALYVAPTIALAYQTASSILQILDVNKTKSQFKIKNKRDLVTIVTSDKMTGSGGSIININPSGSHGMPSVSERVANAIDSDQKCICITQAAFDAYMCEFGDSHRSILAGVTLYFDEKYKDFDVVNFNISKGNDIDTYLDLFSESEDESKKVEGLFHMSLSADPVKKEVAERIMMGRDQRNDVSIPAFKSMLLYANSPVHDLWLSSTLAEVRDVVHTVDGTSARRIAALSVLSATSLLGLFRDVVMMCAHFDKTLQGKIWDIVYGQTFPVYIPFEKFTPPDDEPIAKVNIWHSLREGEMSSKSMHTGDNPSNISLRGEIGRSILAHVGSSKLLYSTNNTTKGVKVFPDLDSSVNSQWVPCMQGGMNSLSNYNNAAAMFMLILPPQISSMVKKLTGLHSREISILMSGHAIYQFAGRLSFRNSNSSRLCTVFVPDSGIAEYVSALISGSEVMGQVGTASRADVPQMTMKGGKWTKKKKRATRAVRAAGSIIAPDKKAQLARKYLTNHASKVRNNPDLISSDSTFAKILTSLDYLNSTGAKHKYTLGDLGIPEGYAWTCGSKTL